LAKRGLLAFEFFRTSVLFLFFSFSPFLLFSFSIFCFFIFLFQNKDLNSQTWLLFYNPLCYLGLTFWSNKKDITITRTASLWPKRPSLTKD